METTHTVKSLITFQEAVELLRISKDTLYRYTHLKKIPFFKIGKRIYFREEELEAWIQDHRVAEVV